MEKSPTGQMSVDDRISDVRRDIRELRERLVQTEGVLFAFLKEMGYAPCQEILRTGDYHSPLEYVPSVKQKGL
jgi:hypothetical protein